MKHDITRMKTDTPPGGHIWSYITLHISVPDTPQHTLKCTIIRFRTVLVRPCWGGLSSEFELRPPDVYCAYDFLTKRRVCVCVN
jgi:hypothetical protein